LLISVIVRIILTKSWPFLNEYRGRLRSPGITKTGIHVRCGISYNNIIYCVIRLLFKAKEVKECFFALIKLHQRPNRRVMLIPISFDQLLIV
jgi:hypothetical protein